jgi:hypothetical protein
MKTRTLLLLAVACAVAIMAAGVALLVQLNGRDEVPPGTPLGEVVTVGEMRIAVDDFAESAGSLTVTIRIGGVVDDDGAVTFRLITSEGPIAPEHGAAGACSATTLADATCDLTFDVSGVEGSARVLRYERGDESARWTLA